MVRRDLYFGGIFTNTPLTSASCHQMRMLSGLTFGAFQADQLAPPHACVVPGDDLDEFFVPATERRARSAINKACRGLAQTSRSASAAAARPSLAAMPR